MIKLFFFCCLDSGRETRTTSLIYTVLLQPHPSIGKPPAVSGSANSETGEVDPQLKLQKEIEVVMAERVEDLMRAIPDSMMRSIMDGKIPLAFLDKISDLIPTEVIEEAVRQKEQSATSDHLKKGTSLTPLAGNQKTMVAAKPETVVTEVRILYALLSIQFDLVLLVVR